jgi:hypothetical protein
MSCWLLFCCHQRWCPCHAFCTEPVPVEINPIHRPKRPTRHGDGESDEWCASRRCEQPGDGVATASAVRADHRASSSVRQILDHLTRSSSCNASRHSRGHAVGPADAHHRSHTVYRFAVTRPRRPTPLHRRSRHSNPLRPHRLSPFRSITSSHMTPCIHRRINIRRAIRLQLQLHRLPPLMRPSHSV